MSIDTFNLFLGVMSLIALFVFIALYFVKAGYGIFRTASWGVAISNKLAWILMEAPVFMVMCVMWIYSERRFEPVIFTFFLFFQIHYFQRAFIFPLLLKGQIRPLIGIPTSPREKAVSDKAQLPAKKCQIAVSKPNKMEGYLHRPSLSNFPCSSSTCRQVLINISS